MKIGIDCRLWNETGVGRYIRNLVYQLQVLDKKNVYILFILSKDRGEIMKQVQNNNFSTVSVDIQWHTLAEQLKFPLVLSKENLDLMHFPYFSVPIFYNRPFVVTIHDLILYHFPTGQASTLPYPIFRLKVFAYKLALSKIVKKARKIITVSNATKVEIVDHFGVDSDKVVVTYGGVNDQIRNSNIEIRNNLQNTKYFLYVGNAYPHKNLDRLLGAFSILISQFSSLNLILVGRQDYFYKRLREKVEKMKLKDSVVFYGEVTDEELASLYKNAKALIMPSLMEGFGLPALEAMANKCLVLVSNIPSLKEICGDAALYFDPYGIKDMSQKMQNVYLNNIYHLSRKIKKGLERAKLFSWEKMTKETISVYESCVGVR